MENNQNQTKHCELCDDTCDKCIQRENEKNQKEKAAADEKEGKNSQLLKDLKADDKEKKENVKSKFTDNERHAQKQEATASTIGNNPLSTELANSVFKNIVGPYTPKSEPNHVELTPNFLMQKGIGYGVQFNEMPPDSKAVEIKPCRNIKWSNFGKKHHEKFEKNTSEEMINYFSDLKDKGYSVGADVEGFIKAIGISPSINYAKSNENQKVNDKLQIKHTSFLSIYNSYPRCTFELTENDIQLNEYALAKARDIYDLRSAEEYLELFGSHFSLGEHQLGIVYSCIAKADSVEIKDRTNFIKAAWDELDGKLGVGVPSVFKLSVGGSKKDNSAENKSDETNSKLVNVEHKVFIESDNLNFCLSPDDHIKAMNLADFSAYAIIKRPTNDRRKIPIWKFLRDCELNDAANKVEEAFFNAYRFKVSLHLSCTSANFKKNEDFEGVLIYAIGDEEKQIYELDGRRIRTGYISIEEKTFNQHSIIRSLKRCQSKVYATEIVYKQADDKWLLIHSGLRNYIWDEKKFQNLIFKMPKIGTTSLNIDRKTNEEHEKELSDKMVLFEQVALTKIIKKFYFTNEFPQNLVVDFPFNHNFTEEPNIFTTECMDRFY